MRSIDTNVLVRAILDDTPAQTVIATAILSSPCLITPTVVLELVWLLSSSGRQSRAEVVDNLGDLLAVGHIRFAEERAVRWALEKFAAGADFADMLHLALSEGADCFATFDRSIARHATDSPVPVETL